MNYTLMYQALKKVLEKDEQINYAMSGKNAAQILMRFETMEESL